MLPPSRKINLAVLRKSYKRKNKMKKIIAIVFLVLSSLACNFGATQPDTTQPNITENSVTESTSVTQAPSQNACDNLYSPVIVGATWTYDLQGPVPDTYVHSIVSIDGNTFVEQDVFGTGVTRQGQWKCENGNLIALNPSSGGSSNVSTENGVSVDFQTTELKGITLPATINAGDTWSQEIFLQGTQTIQGNTFPASNRTTSSCTAIGIESVTVIAGTFDAMKVECLNKIAVSLEMQAGNPSQFTIELVANIWYAPNVGMVKTTNTGSGLDSVIELVSYSIP
jgi:hypothetical protein